MSRTEYLPAWLFIFSALFAYILHCKMYTKRKKQKDKEDAQLLSLLYKMLRIDL